MTQLEDELRSYIRENLMGGTTLLLIKEIGIPILVEYLKRQDKEAAAKLLGEIANDTDILENLSEDMKKGLVSELTDVVSDLLDGLVGKKDK